MRLRLVRLAIRRHSLQESKVALPVRKSLTALGSGKAAFTEGLNRPTPTATAGGTDKPRRATALFTSSSVPAPRMS